MRGRLGIWAGEFRLLDDPVALGDAAAELEGLGFRALFVPGGAGRGDVLGRVASLLDATSEVEVATGILNVWMHEPAAVAAASVALDAASGGRFLLGLGIGHAPLVDRDAPGRFREPLATMARYLDALDAAPEPVRPERRFLAALGPKMLDLSRDRSLGSHPYCTTVTHTRFARERLGRGALLAVGVTLALEREPVAARARARRFLSTYLRLPNYVHALLAHGVAPEDLEGGGSDALCDAVVGWGDEDALVGRVAAHLEAGADHVCVQLLHDGPELPLAGWRTLARLLAPLS